MNPDIIFKSFLVAFIRSKKLESINVSFSFRFRHFCEFFSNSRTVRQFAIMAIAFSVTFV